MQYGQKKVTGDALRNAGRLQRADGFVRDEAHERERRARGPDFLIIGAAKSGTTSLYRYLLRHPAIFMPKLKEPEFFSDNTRFNKGLAWYLSLFRKAKDCQKRGEASTTYTRWPHTADVPLRLHELCPWVKLVYIMRNPVERAYAHYAHHMRLKVAMTFEEALSRSSIYVDCSLYMHQIRLYLRYFPRDAFCFLTSDELKDAPGRTLSILQKFLDVEERDLLQAGYIHSNERHTEFIRHRTTKPLRRMPGGTIIASFIPETWKDRVHSLVEKSPLATHLKNKHTIPPMTPATRASLLRHFEEPNRELAEFLDADLSSWGR